MIGIEVNRDVSRYNDYILIFKNWEDIRVGTYIK